MVQFQEILGMDWLHKNKPINHCNQGTLYFSDSKGSQVLVIGQSCHAPLRVVETNRLVKLLQKRLLIYAIKLNKPKDDSKEGGL